MQRYFKNLLSFVVMSTLRDFHLYGNTLIIVMMTSQIGKPAIPIFYVFLTIFLVRFTWACTKFSLHLKVDLRSPKLRRLLGYLGDQISIANDLASYDKEAKQFLEGRSKEMINLVHTIMQVNRINGVAAAKSMAYAIQLWTENEILEELRALSGQGQLSDEEWKLVDGCLVAASGNLLTSIVISRYGGEEAKIAL